MSPSLEGIMFNRNANLSGRRPLLAEPQKPVVVAPRAPPRDFSHRPLPAPRTVPNDHFRPDYFKPSNVELERRLQEARAREKVGYFQDKVTTPDLNFDRREAELVFRFDPHESAEYLSSQYRAPTVHYAKPATPANGFSNRLPERDGPFVFGVHSPSQFPLPKRDEDDYDYSEVADESRARDDVSSEETNCCDKVNEWTTRDKKARRTLNRMFQIRDRRKVKGGKKEKIKCVLVGDGAVGKSSLIAAYAQDTFREEYTPTAYDTFNAAIVIFVISGMDYLFYVCVSFICIQFKLLQYDMSNYIPHTNTSYKIHPDVELKRRFAVLVKWHQELIDAVKILEGMFTMANLVTFMFSSLLICLCGFNILMIDDKPFIVSFGSFLFACLLQIFMICYFGDMLMRSSSEVGDAIYETQWYLTNASVGKEVNLIQARSQHPCKITAYGFADVNLSAFTKILSTSWSYFALLRTIYTSPRG